MPVRRHAGDSVRLDSAGGGFLGALGIEPPSWTIDAVCAQTDPEAFFPEKGGSTREAKAICRGCPVQVECLDYALANEERYGIWGGVSERDRRKLTKGPRAAKPRDIPCGNAGCPEMFNHGGHAGRHRKHCPFGSESQESA